nr:AEC family transporter [Desulfobacula sp.]
MENLIYLFVMLALGKISRRVPAFPEATPQILNLFVIYFSFPATVLLKAGRLEMAPELAVLAMTPWVLVLVSIFLVRLISPRLNWDRKTTGAVMLCTGLGNTSFFGFPAVTAFFGEGLLPYAIIYDQLGTFLALSIFGTLVVSVYGTSTSPSIKQIVLNIIGFPPFLALLASFCLMKTAYPAVIIKLLEGLSATLIPLVMFSVGAQLRLRQPFSNIKPIAVTIFLKMILFPMIAFAVLFLLNIRGPVFQISVFEAAMPSMVMAGVLAQSGRLNAEMANAAIGYGLILSFMTLPFFNLLLKLFP